MNHADKIQEAHDVTFISPDGLWGHPKPPVPAPEYIRPGRKPHTTSKMVATGGSFSYKDCRNHLRQFHNRPPFPEPATA